ncbi:Hypothetical_protein [Hexamita inflata]|uniref:Hypothetical_protein n=1 Tax=Hexamita inflata TaxID=28002 RepID=A0ABP1H6P9_9EUKA
MSAKPVNMDQYVHFSPLLNPLKYTTMKNIDKGYIKCRYKMQTWEKMSSVIFMHNQSKKEEIAYIKNMPKYDREENMRSSRTKLAQIKPETLKKSNLKTAEIDVENDQ